MPVESPYEKYRNSKLWEVVEKALDALEDNRDINITTHSDYVIGYLVQSLANAGVIDESSCGQHQ